MRTARVSLCFIRRKLFWTFCFTGLTGLATIWLHLAHRALGTTQGVYTMATKAKATSKAQAARVQPAANLLRLPLLPPTNHSVTRVPSAKLAAFRAQAQAAQAAALQAQLAALGAAPAVPATTLQAPQLNAAQYVRGGAWQAVVGKAGSNTLQRGTEGKGTAAWHSTAVAKPNTRAQALAAIAALPQPFTYAQVAQALQPLAKAGVLGSGSPRSYFAAFVKAGYLAPAA